MAAFIIHHVFKSQYWSYPFPELRSRSLFVSVKWSVKDAQQMLNFIAVRIAVCVSLLLIHCLRYVIIVLAFWLGSATNQAEIAALPNRSFTDHRHVLEPRDAP